MKRFRLLAVLAAFVLVLAACGGDDDSADTTAADVGDTATTAADSVDLTQGSDLTFHMVTHSDDGTFWSVVKKGMAVGRDAEEDARRVMGESSYRITMKLGPGKAKATYLMCDIGEDYLRLNASYRS